MINFFERQEEAQKKSQMLVISLVLVMLLTALCCYLGVALLAYAVQSTAYNWLISIQALFVVLLLSVGIMSLGTLWGLLLLRDGAQAVVRLLKGLELDPRTAKPNERRLLNVVEEMAIASGVPVPRVYVLKNQASINAFAAGDNPYNAVIGFTRGALELLNREEIQGVVAHEFSHILNGDMQLNLKMAAVLYGLSSFWNTGKNLLQSSIQQGTEGDEQIDGFPAASRESPDILLVVPALFLLLIGAPGVFLGSLIRSTLSQEREFLADAAAVQFTRNSQGIAGALKKIGGLSQQAVINSNNVPALSHFFFAQAESGLIAEWKSTHPPLEKRIAALDPAFSGNYPEVKPISLEEMDFEASARSEALKQISSSLHLAVQIGTAEPKIAITPETLTSAIGQTKYGSLVYATKLIRAFPQPLISRLREPQGAQAVVYAVLLKLAEEKEEQVSRVLKEAVSEGIFQETMRVLTAVSSLGREMLLPLIDLAVSVLRCLSVSEHQQMLRAVKDITERFFSDNLFAYLLIRELTQEYRTKSGLISKESLGESDKLVQDALLLLCAVAQAAGKEAYAVKTAFERGTLLLKPGAEKDFPINRRVYVKSLDEVMSRLAYSSLNFRRRVLESCTACIAADNYVTAEEAEMLRLTAVALQCPVPPMLPPQQNKEVERQ